MDGALVGSILALTVWIGASHLIGEYAQKKGRSYWGFFLLSTLCLPIGLAIALIASPSEESSAITSNLLKCEFCAEYIKHEAKVCKHCGGNQPLRTIPVNDATAVSQYNFTKVDDTVNLRHISTSDIGVDINNIFSMFISSTTKGYRKFLWVIPILTIAFIIYEPPLRPSPSPVLNGKWIVGNEEDILKESHLAGDTSGYYASIGSRIPNILDTSFFVTIEATGEISVSQKMIESLGKVRFTSDEGIQTKIANSTTYENNYMREVSWSYKRIPIHCRHTGGYIYFVDTGPFRLDCGHKTYRMEIPD